MKFYCLITLTLAFLFVEAVTAGEHPLAPGPIAVYIKPMEVNGNNEFTATNLSRCLKMHLDYFLWRRGWPFDFVCKDSPYSQAELLKLLSGENHTYLLYLQPEATFKTKSIGEKSQKTCLKYRGFLVISLKSSFYNLVTGERIIHKQKSRKSSRKRWVMLRSGEYLKENKSTPETPDNVVKRLISEAVDFLPEVKRARLNIKNGRPLRLVIDKTISDDTCGTGMSDLYTALEYVFRELSDQLGINIKIAEQTHLNARDLKLNSLEPLFNSLLRAIPEGDTLTVGIFRPDDPERLYKRGPVPQIGLSDLGRRTLLITEISPPEPELAEWKAFLMGQLLLHEIGHLLGAVHVSDINSIMYPAANWVSSSEFDRLNRRIISELARKSMDGIDLTGYLNLVADALRETDYGLADFPQFFFSYMNLNPGKDSFLVNGTSDNHRMIMYAVDGYRKYLLEDYNSANNSFYKALVCDSTQAAIYWYLSKVTSGRLSDLHKARAAALGYFQAVGFDKNLNK